MYAPSADGELRALRKRLVYLNIFYIHVVMIYFCSSNLTLREEKSILISQLNSCQDQISALTKELDLYQQLLNDSTTGIGVSSGAGISGSESSDKVRQLLEEIKALRRQLEQSINNNATLSKHLTRRLSVHEDDEPLVCVYVTYVCMYVHVYVCTYIVRTCMYECMYICMYVCTVYVRMYVHTYVCMYILYLYTYSQ